MASGVESRHPHSTSPSVQRQPTILRSARRYWTDVASREGAIAATRDLLGAVWEFLRESWPSHLRTRFGDADYDWDYRVNTTSGAVGWRDRLLGAFHSPYQPTEPGLFHEMLNALRQITELNFEDFTFVDLGSGKGRTLLMASDYPFRRIVGLELLPSLNEIAKRNLTEYKSAARKCFVTEAICADATTYVLPDEPLLIYLFNPFPESGLRRMLANLETILLNRPKPIYLLYHNSELEQVVLECACLKKIGGTHQYSLFSFAGFR
jgi:hypothetical protein